MICCTLIRRGNLGTEIDAYTGRTSGGHESRDQSNASTSQGKPKFAGKPPEVKREA